MKTLCQSLLLTLGALALAGTASAQVPAGTWTGNDTSDVNFNTGMGYGALGGPAPSNGGCCNTASGYAALYSNTTGVSNTASGYFALKYNTTGSYNTASGESALYSNTTADYNTASGVNALYSNTTGNDNTASGYNALYSNISGGNNTASGFDALYSNSTGNNNSAVGNSALYRNKTGLQNTASGSDALYANTTGDSNTASGYGALYTNNGSSNTASGYEALYANSSGINNTANGVHALASNTSGSNNVADGWHAGYNLTTGSNNIDIGNAGLAGDTNTIKIGTQSTQTKTVIAGIYGVSVSGAIVMINSAGQLGAVVSSERFKTAIAPMGSTSEKLQQLRPVTFHLKTDPHGALQYGLIAEEVAKVYPDLVVRNESGRIDSVRYDELAPMLLNEVQQQQQRMAAQDQHSAAQDARIGQLVGQLAEMHAALLKLQSKAELIAQR